MPDLICDASVVFKWFDDRDEPQVAEARRIAAAIGEGLNASVLELTHLEVGNALLRSRRASPDRAARVLRSLAALTGRPRGLGPGELEHACTLAEQHELTLYDAAYWAVAKSLGAALVTSDGALLAADAGEDPATLCERLRLTAG